jgi:hypothetical protein
MADSRIQTRFSGPDTSDKRDDECWVEYWDRKRHERHGKNCHCVLCENEELLAPKHTWCPHNYADDPEVIGNERAEA